MLLNEADILQNKETLIQRGYELPAYDRNLLRENTAASPEWVHFGAGNIAKAYIADIAEQLISDGSMKTGLILCGEFEKPLVEGIYKAHDNLFINVTLCADGSVKKKICGSIAEADVLDKDGDMDRLREVFASKSLQMASFTITEKGYVCDASQPKTEPEDVQNFMGKVAYLLYHRYKNGAYPIAFVSMDNCSHNGDKLKDAMLFYAKLWEDEGFAAYLNDTSKVSFPWKSPVPPASSAYPYASDSLNPVSI